MRPTEEKAKECVIKREKEITREFELKTGGRDVASAFADVRPLQR